MFRIMVHSNADSHTRRTRLKSVLVQHQPATHRWQKTAFNLIQKIIDAQDQRRIELSC